MIEIHFDINQFRFRLIIVSLIKDYQFSSNKAGQWSGWRRTRDFWRSRLSLKANESENFPTKSNGTWRRELKRRRYRVCMTNRFICYNSGLWNTFHILALAHNSKNTGHKRFSETSGLSLSPHRAKSGDSPSSSTSSVAANNAKRPNADGVDAHVTSPTKRPTDMKVASAAAATAASKPSASSRALLRKPRSGALQDASNSRGVDKMAPGKFSRKGVRIFILIRLLWQWFLHQRA